MPNQCSSTTTKCEPAKTSECLKSEMDMLYDISYFFSRNEDMSKTKYLNKETSTKIHRKYRFHSIPSNKKKTFFMHGKSHFFVFRNRSQYLFQAQADWHGPLLSRQTTREVGETVGGHVGCHRIIGFQKKSTTKSRKCQRYCGYNNPYL